ncbi:MULTISPECIES: hypothetical protein [Streptomyces]|uniref:hypothetical protein n=1 Tax=Streptomyces TaxID=1883 RepID=UPI00123C48FF|nr:MULTISPECIES: hypothetical protein [Streptomyces]MYY85006.1 hypothetical protein [Streptomyces sp. SID335]MYZ19544.1 hypothetical protein [Streptomyces sp. SID337]
MRKWRNAVVTAAWVAVGTAAGALGAWQLASSDGAGGAAHSRPLDEAAVRAALTASTPTRASPSASAPPSPSSTPPTPTPSADRSTVRFTGGSATVECRADGTVRLVSWSPADGFHIDDDVERGPGAVARLEAEPGDDDDQPDLPYEIRCADGTPRAKVLPDRDDD